MITFARAVQLHQALRQGGTVVTMAALAFLGLGLVEIGNFEGLRYLLYALTAFWLNGLSSAYLRVRQTSPHAERWTVYFLLIVLLGAVLVFGLFATALPLLGGWLLDTPDLDYGLAFGTFALGSLAGGVVEHEAIADHAGRRLLTFTASAQALQLGLFLGPLAAGLPFYLAIWGLAAGGLYRLAWATARYLRTTDTLMPPPEERAAFWRSASGLSVYGLTAILVIVVDHALVAYSAHEPEVGVALWRYGAQELPLLVGVVSGLNATALVEMQRGAPAMLGALRRRTGRVVIAFMAVAIALAATCRWWYPLVFSETFYPAHVVFATMLLAVPSRLVPTTPLLVSLDLEHLMIYTGVAEAVLNVLVSLALLPSLGLLGIAIGTVVAYAAERAVYVVVLARRGHPPGSYLDLRTWWLGTAALAVAYLLGTDFSALASV